MRVILLSLLLECLRWPSFGQGSAPTGGKTTTVTLASPPLAIPLLGLVYSLPQRPSLDDSLARRFYARNRVKTVALVRTSATGAALDTLDYTELDRAGYPVLTAKPSFKARTHLRYNRRHQLISLIKDAEPSFSWVRQTTYDPATQTTTTRIGHTPTTLALYQTSHSTQHGKDVRSETVLLAVPGLPAPQLSRILLIINALCGDTMRVDVLGYQGEQVVKAESYYTIGRQYRQRESGSIVLPAAGRATRELEGHFIPNQRSTFDAAGRLIRLQSLPAPSLLAGKPVTQPSADGRGSMTVSYSTDTLATSYHRNADGQLLREELSGLSYAGFKKPAGPLVTVYDYLPNGLRRSKLDSQGTRYEYYYSFY